MRQSDIESVLKDVCPDQLEAFRQFAANCDVDELSTSVHYESCKKCADASAALMKLREDAKPPRARLSGDQVAVAVLAVVLGLLAVLVVAFAVLAAQHHEAIMTAAERTASRLRYVRMPGRPETCVAVLPGERGYGPTFLGAAPCSQVWDRVEFDEDASFRLGQLEIVPIEGTTDCLAVGSDDDGLFTFVCSIADDD